MEKKFQFFADSISIEKAKDKDGNEIMRLGGIASTKDKDADGEFLDPAGFDTSYFENEGVVNWHHGAKSNPETIIGEPSKVEMRPEGMYVEVDLYKDSPMGKKVYDLAKVLEKSSKTRRLGFSIEGKALIRDKFNKNVIKKAAITGLAITHMPKNPNTFAQIIKGEVDLDLVEKNQEVSEEELIKSLDSELKKCKIALADEILKTMDSTKSSEQEAMEQVSQNIAKSGGEEEEEEAEEEEEEKGGEGGVEVLKKESVDKKLKELTKGEVFTEIFERFPDMNIAKAKKINFLIQKQAEMAKRKAPTESDINKALEIFGMSEDNSLEKAIEISQELIGDGHDEDDIEGILISKGYEEDVAKKAASKISKKTAPIIDEDEGDEDEGDEDEENIKKGRGSDDDFLQKALSDLDFKQNEIAKATGTVLQKALSDLSDLSSLISGIREDIDSLKKANTIGRKSLPSAAAVENNFGKIEKAVGNGEEILSVKGDKRRILDILEKGAMGGDATFEKALSNFEINNVLTSEVIRRIQSENKVILTN